MPEVTLDQVLALSTKGRRVCPVPQRWAQLYDMLPGRRQVGGRWEPALPLILGAWHGTPALAKLLRLQEHLQWADRHGVLPEVAAFLESLEESDWLHFGE